MADDSDLEYFELALRLLYKEMQGGHLTSDCAKCGSQVYENKEGTRQLPMACAYPDDCPTMRLNDKLPV